MGIMSGLGGIPPRRPDQVSSPPPAATPPTSQSGLFRGRLVIVSGSGFTGVFDYNPTPALNNLVASEAAANGTDPYGNAYLQGQTTYLQTGPTSFVALQNNGAQITFYTASSAAGPWTAQYVIQSDASGNVTITASGTLELNPAGVASVTGPTVIGDTPGSRATAAQLEVHSLIGLKARTQPAAPPAGYGLLYVNSSDGGLYYKGASGTNTKLAPA